MNGTLSKLERIRRLCEIDRSRLTVRVIELAKADVIRKRSQRQVAKKRSELNVANSQNTAATVAARYQMTLFADQLVQEIRQLRTSLDAAKESKAACLQSVVRQQTKIKGWETLIAKLQEELSAEQQNQDSLIADDRYLSDHAGRNS